MIETFYTSLYLEKYGEKFRSIVAVIAKETMGESSFLMKQQMVKICNLVKMISSPYVFRICIISGVAIWSSHDRNWKHLMFPVSVIWKPYHHF